MFEKLSGELRLMSFILDKMLFILKLACILYSVYICLTQASEKQSVISFFLPSISSYTIPHCVPGMDRCETDVSSDGKRNYVQIVAQESPATECIL